MDTIITLTLWITAALFCVAVAEKKQRSTTIAFAMGLLFGFFALGYYLIAPGSGRYETRKYYMKMHDQDLRGGESIE